MVSPFFYRRVRAGITGLWWAIDVGGDLPCHGQHHGVWEGARFQVVTAGRIRADVIREALMEGADIPVVSHAITMGNTGGHAACEFPNMISRTGNWLCRIMTVF